MNTKLIIPNKKLCVFDFDFTLVTSDKQFIYVLHENGEKTHLDTMNWSEYDPKPGDRFDFSELEYLQNPQKISQTWKMFLDRLWVQGYDHTYILSARGSSAPLEKYFRDQDIRVRVVGLGIAPGANNGHWKARWIEEKLLRGEYQAIEFFDDREDCVTEVKELGKKYPHVHFTVWHILNGRIEAFIPQVP